MTLTNKISTRVKEYRNYAKCFGIKNCCIDLTNRYLFNENRTDCGKYWHKKKYDNAKNYIINNYKSVIDQYTSVQTSGNTISSDSPIWILWYQGIETAPTIVRMCIDSVRKHANQHPIVILTANNYTDYVDIPDYIVDKVNSGIITLAQFSDILRMALLSKYGGIWSDATLYWTDDLDKYVLGHDFYSVKHGMYSDWHICKGKWSGFFLASGQDNAFLKFLHEMFYEYWKNENCLFCYYLIDVFIALGYERVPAFQNMVERTPENNQNIFLLEQLLNREFDDENLKSLCKVNWLHKLSWKNAHQAFINNSSTYYGTLIELLKE